MFVIGITSKRDDLDPALRRPGRLDREIECAVPSSAERAEVIFLKLYRKLYLRCRCNV